MAAIEAAGKFDLVYVHVEAIDEVSHERNLELKLKAIEDQFDVNWNGHVGYAGRMDCFSMPPSTLDDCIHICETILAGTAKPSVSEFMGRKSFGVDYGALHISYNPERLIDEGEAPVR